MQLVGDLDPDPYCSSSRDPERADGLDVAVSVLRDSGRGAGQHGACCCFGIDRVGLAAGSPAPPVRAVDLDHPVPGLPGCAGQPGAVAAGAFDAEGVDMAQCAAPAQQ
nr:hypothetical protein [Amycolatopsis camponoti]